MTTADDELTPEELQDFLDQEYPADLAARLRAARITAADDLPEWVVTAVSENMSTECPELGPGDLLADRNPEAYTAYRAARSEALSIQRGLVWPRSDDDLRTRCRRAALDAVNETCDDALYEAEQTYINAIRGGRR
ncbi:MAG: hypothetical protein WAV90_21585 [Gordonia amarae]